MGKVSEVIFCAFCREKRRAYTKKHVTWMNVGLALLAALLLGFIVWQTLDPRSIVFFVGFLAVAEVFVQLRWRLSMTCPYCGFDPVLYTKDHEAAAKKVKRVLEESRTDPSRLLSGKNPLKNLPKLKLAPGEQLQKTADLAAAIADSEVTPDSIDVKE